MGAEAGEREDSIPNYLSKLGTVPRTSRAETRRTHQSGFLKMRNLLLQGGLGSDDGRNSPQCG